MTHYSLDQVVESLIFAADHPVPAQRMASVWAEVTGEAVPEVQAVTEAIERLNHVYHETGRCFRIFAWAGGFRMATTPDVAPFLKAYLGQEREKRLSRSAMEAVAIVAYRQPVTKAEVEFVRGVDSDYALKRLLEMGLIDVVGRSESLGRPLLYGTTGRFLELLGLSSLADLPKLREIEELLEDPAFSRERAQLVALEALEQQLTEAQENASDHQTDHEEAPI